MTHCTRLLHWIAFRPVFTTAFLSERQNGHMDYFCLKFDWMDVPWCIISLHKVSSTLFTKTLQSVIMCSDQQILPLVNWVLNWDKGTVMLYSHAFDLGDNNGHRTVPVEPLGLFTAHAGHRCWNGHCCMALRHCTCTSHMLCPATLYTQHTLWTETAIVNVECRPASVAEYTRYKA